jgi:hypothetical protein
MFAILAAIAFGLALLLELIDEAWGEFGPQAFMILGLLLLAIHMLPVSGRLWRR